MTARGHHRGHPTQWDEERSVWIFDDTGEIAYTPKMAGSGQTRRCIHCGLGPTPEGHDGCLGTLPEAIVMNACCGHGEGEQAYVQFWSGSCIRGSEALDEIEILKALREVTLS